MRVPGGKGTLVLTLCSAVAAGVVTVAVWPRSPGAGTGRESPVATPSRQAEPLFTADLSGEDRLLGNEYEHWNRNASGTVRSPQWDITSGSLFLRNGVAWSGEPDATDPDARSARSTGSSVFRMTTREDAFEDVTVALRLRTLAHTDRGRFPASDFDGVHLFLRWQNEHDLYAVSLIRRDGRVVVKRKTPGGPSNDGTYTELYAAPSPEHLGEWQDFTVSIANTPAGVRFTVRRNDRDLVNFTGPHRQLRTAGAVGLRADNTEFEFSRFEVTR